jgi:hypothetical protein
MVSGRYLINHSPHYVRWYAQGEIIPNAGWHFTCCGPPVVLGEKLNSFSHWMDPHNGAMLAGIKDGTWIPEDGAVSPASIDDSYPAFVRENLPLMKERGLVYAKDAD